MNDGRTVPQLGFGVWQVSTDDIIPAVTKALQVGYRHIDTAAIYGNEEGVGRAIADSGIPRDELFVTTKLWNSRHGRSEAVAAVEESLDKLGLDYVDLYLIHWPTPRRNRYVDAWMGLEDIRERGLSRSIGVSNFTPVHLQRILDAGSIVPAVNQIEVHPTFAQRDVIATNDAHGILTEAYSPLGLAEDLTDPTVTKIADDVERTPAQVILRWHLQQGRIVFPKSVTAARIEENFAIFDFELEEDQLAAIDGVDRGNRLGSHPEEFNAA
jgi:2,5-diketo-D-gluconate reductase A